MSENERGPLIIMKVMGGLGNQLFQYALGRTLALRLGADLAFDLRDLGPRAMRAYGLDAFDIVARVAQREEIARLRGSHGLLARLRRRPWVPAPTYLRERALWTYTPEILPHAGEAYLDGFWQSESYFREAEVQLRKDLVLRRPLSAGDEELGTEMQSADSVSVHIRRGDYVSDEGSRRFYGDFSPAFLEAAVALLLAPSERRPRFYLFSDDPQWVGRNVTLPGPTTIVSDGLRSPQHELCLMARCRHHIVTNSTYSWWGAWLGRQEGGITVGPRRWNVAGVPTPDIVPDWWVTI